MLVSAIALSSYQTIFNTKATNDNSIETETILDYLNSYKTPKNDTKDKKIYDSINEWKNFCHSQIEKGNLDIII